MAYCPECGSEVAPNDTFCAYCGISLPDTVVATDAQAIAEEPSAPPKTNDENEYPPTEENIGEQLADAPRKANWDTAQKDEMSDELMAIETPKSEVIKENETIEPVVEPAEKSATTETENPESISSVEEISSESPEAELKRADDNNEAKSMFEDEIDEATDTEKPEIVEESVQTNTKTAAEPSDPSDELSIAKEDENTESVVDDEVDSVSVREVAQTTDKPEIVAEEATEESLETDSEEKTVTGEIAEPIRAESVVEETDIAPDAKKSDLDSATIDSSLAVGSVAETSVDSEKTDLESTTESRSDETNREKSGDAEILAEKGVVIPTAANLKEQFIPPSTDPESISPSAMNLVAVTDGSAEPAEEKATEKPQDEADAENSDRQMTNPIAAAGENDKPNKTKLKPLDEGTVLNGRYEVVRKIGGGGMGAVYLATDKNLGGVMRAVKEMVQSYIEDEQQDKAVNDFKRESLLLTSLEHNAIPTIYDYFYDEKEGRFYLVMKYVSGGDLAARIRTAPDGRLDEVAVTDWAIQISDVLDYLHNRQPPIVYRDLKPSNIMIDGNTNKLMLIDFGIARWVTNKEEKGVTAVGTMGYAPPELFSGNVEPRSDIYSLGSTMFHLLTGADPQSNPLLIFDFNKNPKPRQINPQLSDQMEQILMRSVEYNSNNRFASALDMREALIQHMENLKKGTVTFGILNTAPGSPVNPNIPVFCGFCGQKIVATDMFCPFCGAQQPLAAQSKKLVQAPPPFVPQTHVPKLVIVATNSLETNDYLLEKDSNLLGRRDPMSNIFPEVDLSKFDPQTKISRRHARIWREGDVYMLEDLGSSNGTTLISPTNGSIRLLPRQPQVVSHGDKVKVGDTVLRFTIG